MRSLFRAALLSLVLGAGLLSAADLTTAQVQQLITAGQAAPVGEAVLVVLAVGGKSVTYSVTRDTLGHIVARPLPQPGEPIITVSQISIQSTINPNGALAPNSVVFVMSDQTVQSYIVQLNPDGTLASLYQAGSTPPGGGGGGGTTVVTGGIGGGSSQGNSQTGGSGNNSGGGQNTSDFPGFDAGQGQGHPPAGAGTADASAAFPRVTVPLLP